MLFVYRPASLQYFLTAAETENNLRLFTVGWALWLRSCTRNGSRRNECPLAWPLIHGFPPACFLSPLPGWSLETVTDWTPWLRTVNPMLFAVGIQSLSHVQLFATPWTAAHQAPLPSLFPGVCSNSCPDGKERTRKEPRSLSSPT